MGNKGRCRVGGLSPPPSSSLSSGHGRRAATHSSRLCHAVAGSLASRLTESGDSGNLVECVVSCSSLSSRHSTIQDARCWQARDVVVDAVGARTFRRQLVPACAPHIFGGVARGKAKLSSVVGQARLRVQSKIYSAFPFPFPFLSPTRPLDSAVHRTHNRYRHSVAFPTRVVVDEVCDFEARRGISRRHKSRPSISLLLGQRQRRRTC